MVVMVLTLMENNVAMKMKSVVIQTLEDKVHMVAVVVAAAVTELLLVMAVMVV